MHYFSVIPFQIFRRVRKIAKSDYKLRHVRPSVRMQQLSFHWTDFHEVLYLSIIRQSVEKFQVSLNLRRIILNFVFTIPECFLNSIKLVLSVKHTFYYSFNVLLGRHVSTFYLVIIRPFT